MAQPFPELEIRNYSDLVNALVAAKNHLGISNETLEELAGLTRGHADKMLGPSRQKSIGRYSLGCLLRGLGIRLRVEIDPEQVRRNEPLWEKRNEAQVREPCRISKEAIERARPIVLAENAKKGWRTRRRAKNSANGHSANGRAAMKSTKSAFKQLGVLVAASVVTWAVFMAIHGLR